MWRSGPVLPPAEPAFPMSRRILVINERDLRNPLAGGAEVHVFEIFKRLVARGHQVTLLAASFKGAAREEDVEGIRVCRLANRYLFYALAPVVARRQARRGSYDVVVDVLNKLPFFSPWAVDLPCFAIVHHLFGTTAFRQVALPVAVVTWLLERLIPSAYSGVPMLAISPSTKDDLVARGIPSDHVWVVPPGVDSAAYQTQREVGQRDPLLLWIGRLEPYKRADVAIEAMTEIRQSVPAARLVVMGSGPARQDLESLVEKRGLGGAVSFTGFVSEQEKVEWLQRAAVVVNTSEKEGWGMTVIEGNACGTPSISSDVAGLRDSVRDGETGLLFKYGDVASLAAAAIRLLNDKDLRLSFGRAGLGWAKKFDWDRVADDTATLIEHAINPGQVRPRLVASPFSP